MEWKVRLAGDETGLTQLSESFSNDPKIFYEDEKYFVWYSEFEGLNKHNQVRGVANDLVRTIRSFGTADSVRVRKLEVSDIHHRLEDGSEHIEVLRGECTAEVSTSMHIERVYEDGTTETIAPSADRMYERTQQSLADEK